jgi:aminoglycoside phosphotransferase (APT) family kinase protein
MQIEVKWNVEDIKQRKPDWSDAKCWQFLEYVKGNVIIAAESAGNNVIDRLLGPDS